MQCKHFPCVGANGKIIKWIKSKHREKKKFNVLFLGREELGKLNWYEGETFSCICCGDLKIHFWGEKPKVLLLLSRKKLFFALTKFSVHVSSSCRVFRKRQTLPKVWFFIIHKVTFCVHSVLPLSVWIIIFDCWCYMIF